MDQPGFKITYCPPGYAYGYDGLGGSRGEVMEFIDDTDNVTSAETIPDNYLAAMKEARRRAGRTNRLPKLGTKQEGPIAES